MNVIRVGAHVTDENVAVLFDNDDEFFEIVDDCDQGVTEKCVKRCRKKFRENACT